MRKAGFKEFQQKLLIKMEKLVYTLTRHTHTQHILIIIKTYK